MLIPLQISPQLGVDWIFEMMNQFLNMNPATMLRMPKEAIIRAVLPVSFCGSLFRMSVINIPERTINGALPLIMTPNTGFTAFRKSRR